MKQSRRQEWMRAGEGNETIKETQGIHRRHRGDTEQSLTEGQPITYPIIGDATKICIYIYMFFPSNLIE